MRGLVLLIGLLVASPTCARTFRCETAWTGPSATHGTSSCLTNSTHLQLLLSDSDHVGLFVLALIPFILMLLTVVWCPLITVGRYCCNLCGSYRRRPGPDGTMEWCCPSKETDDLEEVEKNRLYPRGSVSCTKSCAIVNFVVALVPMIVMINGVAEVSSQSNAFFTAGRGVLDWSRAHIEGTRELVTVNATTTPLTYVAPLNELFFTVFHSQVGLLDGSISSMEAAITGFFDDVTIFALIVALVPVAFLLITALSAVLDCRRTILCVNSVLHYVIIIGYGIAAFLFLALGMFMGDLCGERDAYLANITQPGLISWWAVPECTHQGYFNTSRDALVYARNNRSEGACNGMSQICDASASFDPTGTKVYQCANLTAAALCTDYVTARGSLDATVMKAGAPVRCENGTVNPSFTCDVDDCAQYCNSAPVFNWAANASSELDHANRLQLSLDDHIAQLDNCSMVYLEMMTPLTNCNRLAGAFYQVGAGSFGFTVLFVVGLFVIWRGQKRFFKPERDPADNSDDDQLTPPETDSDHEPYVAAVEQQPANRPNASV